MRSVASPARSPLGLISVDARTRGTLRRCERSARVRRPPGSPGGGEGVAGAPSEAPPSPGWWGGGEGGVVGRAQLRPMIRSRGAVRMLLLGGLWLAAGAGPGPVGAGGGVASDSSLARYVEAHAALAGGEFAQAQTGFEGLPPDFVLADYAAFYAAESRLRAGEEAVALERFRAFPDRFPTSVLVPQALLAATDTAFRLGRWPEAEREARRVLAQAPNHPEVGRILVRLAEARAAQGLVAEALGDLRRRWIEAPASPWGEAAREVIEDLGRR